ncbi:N-acetyltransferase [Paractinoplanes deccanensis]|uniref:N-acetyltransferase n=1 Tax=Paractinoplanes deccanensis TaxID=113561 RepID=A0ABQ3Y735_9ACTN|nr:GNAT family N-acetyltransferase [Actinoplanes deccanensis]GID75806.1 N-acetyltransferase [Actinoplanes deccanensis]
MSARRATPEDAAELVRLRAVMLQAFPPAVPWDDDWREPARQLLVKQLAEDDPYLVAFVVDRPEGGLAACAVGTIEQRLGGPGDPSGRVGYVFSVVTDPDHRRRGHSRACVTALLDWFRGRGIQRVDLRASSDGEHLYESLGFRRTPDPAMRLRFARDQ